MLDQESLLPFEVDALDFVRKHFGAPHARTLRAIKLKFGLNWADELPKCEESLHASAAAG